MVKIIDESEEVPRVSGRRIDMLNVLTVVENGSAEKNFEFWSLSEEEVEAVLEYYEEHKEELKGLQRQETPKDVGV